MKLKFIIRIAILFTLSGCTRLSEELNDKIDATQFGQTEEQINSIVGRAYAALRGDSFEGANGYAFSEYIYFISAISSDEATLPARNHGADWYDGGRYVELQRHTWTTNNTALNGAWSYGYNGVSTVNAIIYQISQSKGSDEIVLKSNAELRAVRAYFYYRLLDWFGNAPIIKDYTVLDLPANATRKEVYDFVEAELTEVIPMLPASAYGRMTQNAAKCLLARLYLNAEIYSGTPQWQKCLDICNTITGQLETDYFTNFLTENQVSKEIIFAIPYDGKAGTQGNFLHSTTTHNGQRWAISPTGNYFTGGGNSLVGQPGLYSSFDTADLRRKTLLVGPQYYYGTTNIINTEDETTGKDLIFTEAINDIMDAGAMEGAHWAKYEFKEAEDWERDHDLVVFRYAEVLLMKAECLLRLGSPAEAFVFLKQIRDRAGLSITPPTPTLNDIDNELRHEFVFEDHRRTDMIRFGTFTDPSMWTWEPPINTNPYTILFPIPKRELDKNNKLKQNPGYE